MGTGEFSNSDRLGFFFSGISCFGHGDGELETDFGGLGDQVVGRGISLEELIKWYRRKMRRVDPIRISSPSTSSLGAPGPSRCSRRKVPLEEDKSSKRKHSPWRVIRACCRLTP